MERSSKMGIVGVEFSYQLRDLRVAGTRPFQQRRSGGHGAVNERNGDFSPK